MAVVVRHDHRGRCAADRATGRQSSWQPAATSRRWRATRCAARRVTVVPRGVRRPDVAAGSGARRRTSDASRSAAITPALRSRKPSSASADAGWPSTTWARTARSPWTIRTSPARVARAVARREADAGHRHRRRGHRIGDRRQQGAGRPGSDVHDADDRAIFARAQRRQRDRRWDRRWWPGPTRRCGSSTSGSTRRWRGALHPAPAEDRRLEESF